MLLRFRLPPSSDALLELCLVPVHVWQDLQHESCSLVVLRAAPDACAGHVVDRLELHPLGFPFCVLSLNRTPAQLTFDADPMAVPVLPSRHLPPAVRTTPLGFCRTRWSHSTIIRRAIVEVLPLVEIRAVVVHLPRPVPCVYFLSTNPNHNASTLRRALYPPRRPHSLVGIASA